MDEPQCMRPERPQSGRGRRHPAPSRLLRRGQFALFVEESPNMLGQLGREKFHGHRFRISAHHFIGGWNTGWFRVHGISPNLDLIIRLR
jgi:hypothetical protein